MILIYVVDFLGKKATDGKFDRKQAGYVGTGEVVGGEGVEELRWWIYTVLMKLCRYRFYAVL